MTARWSSTARLTAWAWLAAVLGSAALAPLVADNQFLVAGAFAGALVAATGALCRLGHMPAPVIVPLQLVVLFEWMTFAYARSEAFLGVIPTGASTAHLVDLVRSAVETVKVSVPPAPVDTALLACLAAIVALVVLAVDLVAVTWRRPALVGLLFLGIYMAPVSLLAGNAPVTSFVPGAIGYVFLLAAEQRDRLGHWGRQITHTGSLLAGRESSTPTVTSLVSAGRRVGFSAVALAVVLPVLVPTLPRTLFGDGPLSVGGEGGGGGSGDGSVELENPFLDLKRNLEGQSDEVLMTFTTDDPSPGYLRLAALDEFTGETWQAGPRTDETALSLDQTPIIPGLNSQVAFDRVTYDLRFSSEFQSDWLPNLYPVTDVEASGPWTIDALQLDVSAGEDVDTHDMGYSFTSLQVNPSREQLESAVEVPAPLDPFLELPSDLPPEIASLASSVTSDASLPIDQALALQNWFREDGGFKYSTDREPGGGLETIQEFLTTSRTGYCEQFAAAMALMARSLGIPSRVAVGFLRPETLEPGEYAYRGTDMHAWPELYFDGVGWLRFEPTPASWTGDAAPTYTGGPVNGSEPTLPASTTPSGAQNPDERTPLGPTGAAAGSSGGDGGDGTVSTALKVGIALLALIGLAVAPRFARAAVRRRRWARAGDGAAEPAWQELRDSTVDLGLAFDDRATLRTAGQGLRTHLGGQLQAVDALNRLVVRVEQARFARAGRGTGTAADVEQARADVETVIAGLAAGRNRRRLLRATWLPLSLVRRVRGDAGAGGAGRGLMTRDGGVVQVEGTATR